MMRATRSRSLRFNCVWRKWNKIRNKQIPIYPQKKKIIPEENFFQNKNGANLIFLTRADRYDDRVVGAGLTDGCPVSHIYIFAPPVWVSKKTNDAHPSVFSADFWLYYIVAILFRINVVHYPPCPLLLGPRTADKKKYNLINPVQLSKLCLLLLS
jgi:hypothetical protein